MHYCQVERTTAPLQSVSIELTQDSPEYIEYQLVVHPSRLSYFGEGRTPRLTARLMSTTAAPDQGGRC
jgi:hypothetical protein